MSKKTKFAEKKKKKEEKKKLVATKTSKSTCSDFRDLRVHVRYFMCFFVFRVNYPPPSSPPRLVSFLSRELVRHNGRRRTDGRTDGSIFLLANVTLARSL